MVFTDPRKDRTALRLRLLENGYPVVPLLHKQPFLENWNTIEVTEDLIRSREWARGRLKDTGIRCDNLVAVDIDIDDPDLVDEYMEYAVAEGLLPADHPVIRTRDNSPRLLLLFRTHKTFAKRTSGKYKDEAETEEFQIEVLSKGNQFAAYGLHTSGAEYRWPKDSPLDTPFRELPETNLEEVEALIAGTKLFFQECGLVLRSRASLGELYQKKYDLEPHMVFSTDKYGRLSVQDMLDMFRRDPDAKIRMALDPLVPGQTNTDRSIATAHNVDGICISDYGEEVSHFLRKYDLEGAIEALQSAIMRSREVFGALPEADTRPNLHMDVDDSFDIALSKALQRYVFWPQANQVLDTLKTTLDTNAMTMAAFRTKVSKWFFEGPCAPRAESGPITRLGDAWATHADRIDIDGVVMRPDKDYPYYSEGENRFFNTYRPQVFESTAGSARGGIDFFTQLLPDHTERTWFLQMLKHKVENPHIPGPGTILVSDRSYGSGRGTLYKLLELMFNERYVINVTFDELAGNTTQSQYNEWQEDALFVVVNEAKEPRGLKNAYQAGVGAYERLKEIVDPAPRKISLVRKGRPNGQGRTCCTVIVATNHKNAVIVPANDRRLAVLTNGAPADPEFWIAVNAWMENPANIGAFMAWLRGAVSLDDYSPYVAPPQTAAKTDMVEAGVSDLDTVFREALGDLKGPIVSKMQLLHRMSKVFEEHDFEAPDNWESVAGHLWKSNLHALPPTCDAYKIAHMGKTQYPRAIRISDVEDIVSWTRPRARVILSQNDPVVRSPLSLVPKAPED